MALSQETSRALLQHLRVIYPIFLLTVFISSFFAASAIAAKNTRKNGSKVTTGPGGRPLPKRSRSTVSMINPVHNFSSNVRSVFKWLSAAVLITFVVDASINVAHAITARSEHWWCGQSVVVHIIGSFFVYAIIFVSLIDTNPSPTYAQLIPWLTAIPMEFVILGTSLSIYLGPHHEPIVGDPDGGRFRPSITAWELMETLSSSLRILFLIVLVSLYKFGSIDVTADALKSARRSYSNGPDETTGLLDSSNAERGVTNGDCYDSTKTTQKQQEQKPVDPWVRPTTVPSTSWWEYLSGYSLFFPYLWPSKSRRLQLIVLFCFGLVILQRIINVLVPLKVGAITNVLSKDNGKLQVPWADICLYILYRSLQGNQGLIGSLRSSLWIPVSQYSYMELSTAAFEHVHSLSLEFHLNKKTGEVLSALGKGNSINNFLEQITFQVAPMLVDLIVAIVYFLVAFDAYYALVVSVVTFCYLYVTIRMAQWRAKIRRRMVNLSRQEDAVKNDSMVSYETVKYFNAEDYEFDRYRSAVHDFQGAEYQVLFSLTLMNTCQNAIFMLGLLITCFIAAYQVAIGQRPVGDFVALLTYMAQLQGPLNFVGTFYRSMQTSLINAERLLELFREQPTVVDSTKAIPLRSCSGDIRFDNVEFSYDGRRTALDGLTFRCEPGTTTALVGESGGGKSTIFRLLFRFYNARKGTLRVDGHDVGNLTIDSLRKHIGIVPQDTVLFNESLMYNLKYANQNATDEEVFDACRAASIHDRIMSFPDAYQTKVGERGLRLSGGEKQRVAIARTILKNPRIILLDEATAALDTATEEHIQDALASLSRGRTVLVIAHRLSTITTADRILVLHEGRVVESGTHDQLLSLKGRYSSMWRKQVRAQRAAAEAQVLQDRAQRLRSVLTAVAGDDSSSQSDEDRHGDQPTTSFQIQGQPSTGTDGGPR